jgi:ATP-dependent DNA helicase DinG
MTELTPSEYAEPDSAESVEPETVKLPHDGVEILDAVLAHRGWDRRAGQVQVVDAISDAVNKSYPGSAVDISANAPVGTGKSLAYIIAGLAAGKRMVVATSTKSLQDQLIKEELPKLKEDLMAIYGFDLTYGMMKGKSNYPCLSSTRAMLGNGDKNDLVLFDEIEEPDSRDIETLKEILTRAEHAQETRDVLSFDAEALMGRLRPDTRKQISGSKNCAMQREKWIDPNKIKNLPLDIEEGARVQDFPQDFLDEVAQLPAEIACTSRCIYRAAYGHALDSQIVVVNTTLLAYELIKTDGYMSEESLNPYLLKGIDMLVVDEAHHLFRILAEAFSVELNVTKSMDLVDDISKKLSKRYGDDPMFDRFRNDFIDAENRINHVIDGDAETENEFRKDLAEALVHVAGRSESFVGELQTFAANSERQNKSGLALDRNGVPKVVASMGTQIAEDIVANAIKLSEQLEMVDSQKRHQFSLNFSDAGQPLNVKTVPIDVSFFRKMVTRSSQMQNIYTGDTGLLFPATLVLSSGTISRGTPITVGMKTDNYVDVESPFDANRVRVYVPKGLGMPKGRDDRQWAYNAWNHIEPHIVKLNGRTLILTTSHQKCEEFTTLAREALPAHIEVLSQSDRLGKGELIAKFKESPSAVLVGTTSFWEGVDIPGDDLNLVVIEKLPFPQPNDPIFKAREEFVKERGGNPFMEVGVDYAATMLAQGTGRLIRAVKDIGGIIILDDRVLTTRYAGAVVNLLPKGWKVTTEREAFGKWMSAINPETRKEPFVPSAADPSIWRNIGGNNQGKRRSISPH